MKKINIIIAVLLLFTVKVNAQMVLPSGGVNLEDWYRGNTVNISWISGIITSPESNRVKVILWNASDNTSTIIADNIEDFGNLQFKIPSDIQADKRYKIKIQNIAGEYSMVNEDYIAINEYPTRIKDSVKDRITDDFIKAYPNPSSDFMNIEFTIPQSFDYKLSFFDNIGNQITNIISKINIVNENIVKINLDLSKVSIGKYYFVYNSNNGPKVIQFMKID